MLKRIDLEIMNHLNIMATMPDIANQIEYYNKHNEVLVITAYRPEHSKSKNETRNKLLYEIFANSNLEIYKFSYNQRKAFFDDIDFEDIELLLIVDIKNTGVLSEKLSLAKAKLDLYIEDFYRELSNLTILPKYQQIRFVSYNDTIS
ncbi:hypothetical protein [Francisella philomiragia]|uniref:Uncharacterized protein n=1 Tax=Francisella philomiragia TaxID=28110 RepID=A0A0B6D757_9GAMM|nr:hypothetical protein [Francisella philomiragia]AJI53463.1 hypothetical protein LA55_1530 [Francisella philomiragia]